MTEINAEDIDFENGDLFESAIVNGVNKTRDVIEAVTEGPDPLSPEWHDYVMSQFLDSELVEINGEKYPNAYGLRRVAEKLLGTIIATKPVQTFMSADSTTNSPGRVTVVYEVAIRLYETGDVKVVGDIAEVFSLNCDDMFLAYPAATACTRAEGRCLRKALKLRCVAAEEITRNKDVTKAVQAAIQSKPTDGSYNEADPISSAQIGLLDVKCKQMNIDLLKFINIGEKTYNKIEEVSKKTGSVMIQLLGEYQNNTKKVPDSIVGYDKNWRITK
jgi:hypothetical protein